MKKPMKHAVFWAILLLSLMFILIISGEIQRNNQIIGAQLTAFHIEVIEKYREHGKMYITVRKNGEPEYSEDVFFQSVQTIRVPSEDMYNTILSHQAYPGINMRIQMPVGTAKKMDGMIEYSPSTPWSGVYFMGEDGAYLNIGKLFRDPGLVKEYVVLDHLQTEYEDEVQWLVLGRAGGWYPAIRLDTAEAVSWGQSMDGTEARLTFEGESWAGNAVYQSFGSGIDYLYVQFGAGKGPTQEQWVAMQKKYPGPSRWYRDAYWNVQRLGLSEDPAFAAISEMSWQGNTNDTTGSTYFDPYDCTRIKFAAALAVAAGKLEAINQVEAIPNITRDDFGNFIPYQIDAVYKLYEAGVLTGVDEQMNFAPLRKLTRAEAAAIVARVLNPALRVSFHPET